MAYELPLSEEYQWAEDSTFGSTAVTHLIVGPRGRVGFVRDISCQVTTSLVGSTSVPEIMVGISSGDTTYGRYRLGTATGTGYGTGAFRASDEAITGNPPRTLGDFASHVVLDGGPYSTSGSVAGGSSTTLNPAGRIPAGPWVVTNVINGSANVDRVFLRDPIDVNLKTGQLVNISGVGGTNSTINAAGLVISAISLTANYIEIGSTTFSGTYTSGGLVMPVVTVTGKLGVGGSPAGGGIIKVLVQWVGVNTP